MSNYAKILKCDIANGTGFHVSIWLCGCPIHCPGCFNKELWRFDVGKPVTEETYTKVRAELMKPWCDALTILGGEPMCDENVSVTAELIRIAKECGKDVWVFTGYYIEELSPEKRDVIYEADVIIDGPFVESLKDLSLLWRGSSNQHIWMKPHGMWEVVS